MTVVKVSPKYQVVLPRQIRRALGITAGQKMEVLQYGDRVELIPVRRVRELRGFLAGLDTAVPREDDRV